MTTFKIDTNDTNVIREIKEFVSSKFHFDVQVIKENQNNTEPTKWTEFAQKMDGLFNDDIMNHLNKSRKEARENFIANTL